MVECVKLDSSSPMIFQFLENEKIAHTLIGDV